MGQLDLIMGHISGVSEKWESPPPEVLKFNVEDAMNPSIRECSCGGILRNHEGDYVQTFQFNIGKLFNLILAMDLL